MFGDDAKRLSELTKYHNTLQRQYESAAEKLKGYRDELKQFKDTVTATIVETGNVTNLGAQTYDGIVRGMQRAADNGVKFNDVVSKLIGQGLNETTLRQILAAGPETGLRVAEEILRGGVGEINKIQKQIEDATGKTANAAGNGLYGDP